MRLPSVLLLVLLAGLGVVALLLAEPDEPPRRDVVVAPDRSSEIAVSDEAEAPRIPPARLEGRSSPDPSPSPEETAPAPPVPKARPSRVPTGVIENVLVNPPGRQATIDVRQLGAMRWQADDPHHPERPARPDWSLGDPGRRDRVARAVLLTESSIDRALPTPGVHEVDHEEAGQTIEPEIEEPLVTAIRGVVVAEGSAVTGAEVVIYSTFYQRHSRYDRHVREVGRTRTDGAGAFDLRPVGLDTVHFGADGELLLTVRSAGYGAIVSRRADRIRPEVENDLGTFELSANPSALHGTILDLAGQPVVGAAVRVSGSVNPVRYDKVERMVILKDCPTTITDDFGRYRLTGFAEGRQHVSIHVNIDCVLHQEMSFEAGGESEWSPRVRAGGSVEGRVVDPDGHPVAAAVVSGGGNWTPTNADGTYWLDNIDAGPFTLHVAHHAWASVYLEDVSAGTADLEVAFVSRLLRITLFVRDQESYEPLGLIAVDWTWKNGSPPHPFVPESRYWHSSDGRYEVIVPEGAVGASVSAKGYAAYGLEPANLADGGTIKVFLSPPPPPEDD